jgi:serine/threonine protein kinase
MSIIGKTLNQRFHILKPLAQGGFGHTYLAEDLEYEARHNCVVKHLNPSEENLPHLARIKELFEREADTLAKLSLYSNLIPKLIDRFEEAGELYLVQEFIDGVPLSAELIPGKKFTEEATIELLLQILIPLDYCHRENLLHRDLKPANIMRRRQTGELVLIDFGLAKDMGVGSITHKSYGGTPGYAPEEQQYGLPVLASDVYAVGMIAIQALTGKHPAEFSRNPQTREWEWDKYLVDIYRFADVLCNMIHPSADSRYQNAQDALADVKLIQSFQYKPYKFTSKLLVKSNVKGKTPTQMWEDWLAWNKFIETVPTEDQKAEKSKQLGIIDGLPFTYIIRTCPGLMRKNSDSLQEFVVEIDLQSIESKYQEAKLALRNLVSGISDNHFQDSETICVYSDWVKGFIPMTTIRLARLEDIYQSLIYFERLLNDSHQVMPIFAEISVILDWRVVNTMMRTISELIRDLRKNHDFTDISYLLEVVYSDAGQNDFYLFGQEID